MIINFGDKQTAKIFNREFVKRIPKELQKKALRRLAYLHVAEKLSDLQVPHSNHFEALVGDLVGFYSIRVNQQWRIIFCWQDGASEVQLTDYH